jgi:hypothetical protein
MDYEFAWQLVWCNLLKLNIKILLGNVWALKDLEWAKWP